MRLHNTEVSLAGLLKAVVAQLVERVLGKDEVTSSILVNGSNLPAAIHPLTAFRRIHLRAVLPHLRA